MAFNPFRRFRKHQKVIMAGIILLSMVTFIGISGAGSGGDFFSDVTRLFTRQVAATDVGSLYGKEISENQLRRLRKQRQIANVFMQQATEIAYQKRIEAIRKTLGDSPQAQQALFQHMMNDPDLRQLAERAQLGQMGMPYFGGSLSTEGLLDFLIWKHQADRLGIKLTPADISSGVAQMTIGMFPQKASRPVGWPSSLSWDSVSLEKAMRSAPEFRSFWSDDILMTSLTDEFRVRMAQNVLTGFEPGSIDKVAAPVTPSEFWNFYKDNFTSVEVALVPVRVEDFVSQVKEKPTEEELKDLYNKFKDLDYDPESPLPGFKRPHRIQLEWVSANADSPYFKQLANDSITLVETLQQVLAGTLPGPAVAGTNIALARCVDDRLVQKYRELRWRLYRNPSLAELWLPTYPMLPQSFAQPIDVAALVGQSLGLAGTPAAALAAVTDGHALATRAEIRERAIFGLTLAHFAGPYPQPLAGAVLAAYGTPKEEYVPFEQVKDEVREKVAGEQAREVRNYVVKELKKEIEKLAKKDKKAVAKYVAEAVQKDQLQTGKTNRLRGQYQDPIADDPGLAMFKEAFLKPPSEDPTGKKFVEMFFPQQFGSQRPWETYSPREWADAVGNSEFLYWKTEDQPSKVMPFSDPEVRGQVERAWRFQKARELAKKEADQLAGQVRAEKGDLRKLKDLTERQKKQLIELMPMAALNRKRSFSPDGRTDYEGPRIPEDRVPHVQGRSPFAQRIVDLRNKEVGDTIVLSDQPEDVYYVAVLLKKQEPSLTDFYNVYENSAAGVRRPDPLLKRFEAERQGKYRMQFLERLRKDAKLIVHAEAAKRMDEGGGE